MKGPPSGNKHNKTSGSASRIADNRSGSATDGPRVSPVDDSSTTSTEAGASRNALIIGRSGSPSIKLTSTSVPSLKAPATPVASSGAKGSQQ
ncbi:hypothetical protein D3C78_1815920 [compost metagenome]